MATIKKAQSGKKVTGESKIDKQVRRGLVDPASSSLGYVKYTDKGTRRENTKANLKTIAGGLAGSIAGGLAGRAIGSTLKSAHSPGSYSYVSPSTFKNRGTGIGGAVGAGVGAYGASRLKRSSIKVTKKK